MQKYFKSKRSATSGLNIYVLLENHILTENKRYFFFRKFISDLKKKVMNTAELKINLINQIANMTDKVRLKELLQLLDFQKDESVYLTTSEEKEALLEAQKQIDKGEVVSHDEVQKEIMQWLNK